ncbi:H/ACA ribonucleoprotein complex subunit 2 isoform X1 [Coturnix japonica]|uniref:H/ACA ribonucleoprotein complex subunit 2 isoform X1 n=1 Tax=Coturnix japonica TaxID=93934 RepID=UPI0013A5D782|nr:H/ACA ribonucleoprotein complex subunit 2 isoform X1 [Coturnix japonica]
MIQEIKPSCYWSPGQHSEGLNKDKTQESPGEEALCEPDSQEINQDQDQDDRDSTSTDPMLGSTSPANTQLMQLSWDNPMQHSHFKRTVLSIWKMIASHRCSGPFLKAVSEKQAPGYSEVVKRPMDLTSIKRGLAKGHIRSLAQFQCSLMLMFQNAIMYNAANHHVHRMALEMRREVLEQMQMLGEALLRSEHRPAAGRSGQTQTDPEGSEGGAEIHQQRREGDHGAGRRHAAHRRVLPYPHHVRRQEPALRLRPLQVVLNWDLAANRKEALAKVWFGEMSLPTQTKG